MPHFPKPYHRPKRNMWYVQIHGTEHKLSSDRDEAFRLYGELMARKPEEPRKPGPMVLAVEIIDAFLEWAKVNRDPLTYEAYERRLQSFVDAIPKLISHADLKPHHVTRVLDANDGKWNNNTKHDFATSVQRAFNWAMGEGLIDRNPLAKVAKPGREARKLAVSPADYAAVMEAIDEPNFRQLLDFAWESGVRPQEVVKIEARHVNFELRRIVFPPKESKGKKRHRIVYLTDAGLGILKLLTRVNPEGPVFRNSEGARWNKDSINCAMCRLRLRLAERLMDGDGHPRPKKGRIPSGLSVAARSERSDALDGWKKTRAAYVRDKVPKFHLGAWRKGYATEALKAGVDLSTVASLLGHVDGRMVASVYSKVL